MRRGYRLSDAAGVDLLQIWKYLAERASLEVADKVIADLYEGMDKVGKTPALGHSREDLTKLSVKFYRVHRFLIVFVTDATPIVVIRILHGSRDISAVLET
jgi:plasmid stabilization system protein ParE